MLVRNHVKSDRRGLAAVECAIVYPVTIMLVLGSMILGFGVFRFQQLQTLAREGARFASVRGPIYAATTGNAMASTSTVGTYVQGMAVGMNGLTCSSVNYTSTTSLPSTVTVTLSFTWKPEGYFHQVTWTASSTEIVTY